MNNISHAANIIERISAQRDAARALADLAPELLAAAKKALQFIETLPYTPSNSAATKAQDTLVDIIARAEGRALRPVEPIPTYRAEVATCDAATGKWTRPAPDCPPPSVTQPLADAQTISSLRAENAELRRALHEAVGARG